MTSQTAPIRQAAKALSLSEAQLRDFVENSVVPLHCIGADGVILWANRAELGLLGYAREEYIGRHITEFHADAPVIQDILARLTRGETLRDYAARLLCKDGAIRHVLISSNGFFENGEFSHTRCVTPDVTEQKKKAELNEHRGAIVESRQNSEAIEDTASLGVRSPAVLEHERRAAVILDGMYQFVAILNPRGDILEVNQAALEGAGHQIEEIRGKPFWTARWWQVSEKIREDLRDAIRRAAAGEFVRYEVDIYGEQAGLVPITIDFSLQPIRGKFGEVEYLLPEGRNITERKQAEEEVARQSQELRILNERLQELDRLKTLFFANVSHEFRTPLTLMLGPLEDLLTGPDRLDARRQELVQVAHRNGLRLLKQVNTLLDFSRIEAGRMQANYQATDLAEFTTDLASSFRAATQKAGLQFEVDCPLFGEPVYIDRDMWEKIVLNLISNAFKFTLAGEIKVALRPSPDGSGVQLTVADTGTGIPAEELPRIFDRFHRVESSRGRSHEGSGIGLALVQELVKLHAGTITVRSELDRGSIFTVSIPFGTAHLPKERIGSPRSSVSTAIRAESFVGEALSWVGQTAAERIGTPVLPERPASSGGGRPRVLVADDNADMREHVSRILGADYDLILAVDGAEALSLIKQQQPDLILTDVMMPNLDGFGLLRALRSDPATNTLPIIFLSARAGDEACVEGLESGADDYLIKPFTAKELKARVGAHVDMARLRRQATQALRLSEDRYRTLFHACPTAVYSCETSGVILDFNPCAAELWGREPKPGDTDERFCGSFKLYRPDGTFMPHDQCPMAEVLSGTIPEARDMEVRIERPDGSWVTVVVNIRVLKNERGEITGAINCFVDVTERQRVQAALRGLNEDLKHFSYAASHDLQEPLRMVTIYTQLLARDYKGKLDENADQYIAYAVEGAHRMEMLLKGLRDYWAVNEETVQRNVLSDCNRVLEKALGYLNVGIRESAAVITHDPLPTVMAEAIPLVLLFKNLVGNAMKYTRPGEPPRIHISAQSSASAWTFFVQDHGIGIENEHLGEIFAPFKRLNAAAEYPGSGLGLAICQRIVKRYKGRIWVESTYGQGSTFHFTIPLQGGER